MVRKRVSICATHALCLLLLCTAGVASAQQTTLLAGPEELSGDEVVIDFDDQGFVQGDEIAVLSGVDFQMTDGSAALFTEDTFPRPFGPTGMGAVDNFQAWGFPFPGLSLVFEAPVHTLAFGMRANQVDNVQITFFSEGTMVDQLTLPSRGSDQFYFYGFHNEGGFDEVAIDVLGNFFLRTGAFSLDNLTFDGAVEAAPMVLSCEGFDSPLDQAIRRSRHSQHLARLAASMPRKFLTAKLMDVDGVPVMGPDVAAPPVIRVFRENGDGEDVEMTALVAEGGDDLFVAHDDGTWSIELDPSAMRRPGRYLLSMESGDEAEYTIEPTCEKQIVRKGFLRRRHSRRH